MVRGRKASGSGPKRGFTLIELALAISVAGIITIVGLMLLGRLAVDDRVIVKAGAKALGLEGAKLLERHNWWPTLHGCGYDDAVAGVVEGKDAKGDVVTVNVCCGSWLRGCEAAESDE